MSEQSVLTYYDQKARWDPEGFDWKSEKYKANRAIRKSFDWIDWSGADVLEIGCGVGYYALERARFARHVDGIDLSNQNIELARRHADRLGITNVAFRQSDLFNFQNNTQYDIVYAITVLMHIQDLVKASQKINALVRPGGYFLISDLNRFFHGRIQRFLMHKEKIFMRAFTYTEIRKALGATGFQVLRESGRLYTPFGMREPDWVLALWLEALGSLWPMKCMGEHVAVLALKIGG